MKSIRRVDKNGIQEYFNENGEYHREDGPAYESPSGHKEWCIDGKYHREDGPARIYPNGNVDYFLNDVFYSKEDYEQEVLKLKLKRLFFIYTARPRI